MTRVDRPAVQLVRPSSGISMVVARGETVRPYHLGADGGCPAWVSRTRQLTLASAVTGRTYPLGLPADLPWETALTWVPGDDAVGPRGP